MYEDLLPQMMSPQDVRQARLNFVKDALRAAPIGVAIAYRDGVLFAAENPYLAEESYQTDPVTSRIGFMGTGRLSSTQTIRRHVTTQADVLRMQYATKRIGGEENVTARFITENVASDALSRIFQSSAPLETVILIADDNPGGRLHTVFPDGTHVPKIGVASIGGAELSFDKPNAAETYVRDQNLWRPDLAFEDALALAARAIRYGSSFAKRDLNGFLAGVGNGTLLEVSTVDRTLPELDKWAPVLPARGPAYAASTHHAKDALEIAVQAVKG